MLNFEDTYIFKEKGLDNFENDVDFLEKYDLECNNSEKVELSDSELLDFCRVFGKYLLFGDISRQDDGVLSEFVPNKEYSPDSFIHRRKLSLELAKLGYDSQELGCDPDVVASGKKSVPDLPLKVQKAKFEDYIKRTAEQSFIFISSDSSYVVPYKHRWELSYRKGIMAKLYQLQIWAQRHNMTCGMLSLTSAQTGYSDIEILNRFRDSWALFQDNLHKMGFQVFRLYEPHKSGVPHMHVLIFGDCSEKNISRLEGLWHEKYEMGEKYNDFSFSPGLRDNPQLKSVVNYLMKYLSKTVISDFLDNPSLMRFHSLFFHTGARMLI